MGIRTRGLDTKAGAMRNAADKAARAEAEVVIQRWDEQLALGRDMLSSPTIRARRSPVSRVLDRQRHRCPHLEFPRFARHAGAARDIAPISRMGARR
jgi:hypothetical protein